MMHCDFRSWILSLTVFFSSGLDLRNLTMMDKSEMVKMQMTEYVNVSAVSNMLNLLGDIKAYNMVIIGYLFKVANLFNRAYLTHQFN